MKRFISALLILSLVFAFASCDNGGNGAEGTTNEEIVLPTPVINSDISLPFTAAADFNPYSTSSALNRDILPIIFESLFFSDSSSQAIPILAVSGKNEGDYLTVKLSQNSRFSDGTVLKGGDVKASFEKAKASSYYSDQLKNFSGVTVIDNYTLKFSLYNPDPLALNSLDFPIAKAEGKGFIGTGKYYLASLEGSAYLQVNSYHKDYNEGWNKQIALYDMAGTTSPLYPFKANEISVFKNDLTEEYINLSSKTVSVGLDNLVYIGVNSKWAGSLTSIPWIRQAVNIGINRSSVAAASFLGQGAATVTPFKNGIEELQSTDIIGVEGDVEKAIGILERHGYDKFNSEGIRTNGSSSLRVNILVCTKNKYKLSVAESFKTALERLGFGVTITKMKTAKAFTAALEKGHYSFYVGETMLTPNCDLSEFFSEKGALSYGINEEFNQVYFNYKSGSMGIKDFVESFCTEVPFLPLFYRKAVVSINPNISGVDTSLGLYSSVCDWKVK